MAASDSHQTSERPAEGRVAFLPAAALMDRLDEEINRAVRHGTALSCLLVTISNFDELAREYGSELTDQMLSYLGSVLRPQLRHFDRVGRPSDTELLLVLPGADGARGEMVARRVLDRLRTIKIEADGTRQPLRIGLGLAAWQADQSSSELLESTRAAARRGGAAASLALARSSPPALGRPEPS